MSLRALIEKELEGVNDAFFQDVANAVIAQEYGASLAAPGTVIGKDKTRPGRPDAFFTLPNGQYIVAEHTTLDDGRRGSFFDKLGYDLKGCLDFERLGITPDQVDRIVLCSNGRVALKEREALKKHTDPFDIALTIKDIQELAHYLSFEGRAIVKAYMSVPVPGGYLLTRQQFLEQYQKRHVFSPLDTIWVGRYDRVTDLATMIKNEELVVVKGAAGVGKTRMVLEAIGDFLSQNSEHQAFYVLHQAESIENDLLVHIQPDKRYILLLDDANWQLGNLRRSITQLVASAKGAVKIVATVRDYAKTDVTNHIREMNSAVFPIDRWDDEMIGQLVHQVCPSIRKEVQDWIVRISAGNPRLAIMAAITVRDHPDANLPPDAGSIYANYFDPIIDQNEVFRQPAALKAMGLIALFHSLDLETKEDKERIAQFGCTYDEFLRSMRELHALEFVEVHDDFVVRIAEPTMATYFFYKVFIKERLCSFSDALYRHFETHWWQMRDAFIPANDVFGTGCVLDKVRGDLMGYYNRIRTIPETRQTFLKVFGRYFPNEVFQYIIEETQAMEDSLELPSFLSGATPRRVYYGQDIMLDLLEQQWQSPDKDTMEAALAIAFHYIRKRPQRYETLLRKWREGFAIQIEEPATEQRQKRLVEWLQDRLPEGELYQHAFYTLARPLLVGAHGDGRFYQQEEGKWVLHPGLAGPRQAFWKIFCQNYSQHLPYTYRLLIQYLEEDAYYNPVLLTFDLPYIKRLINSQLKPADFGDAYFVHSYAAMIDAKGLMDEELKAMRTRFRTSVYRIFEIYADDRFLGQREGYRHQDVEKIKSRREAKVRRSIQSHTLEEYKRIFTLLEQLSTFAYRDRYTLGWAHDVAVSIIASKSKNEGIKVLQFYLEKGDLFRSHTQKTFRVFFDAGPDWTERLRAIIEETAFMDKFRWWQDFYWWIPQAYVTKQTVERLVAHYEDAHTHYQFFEGSLGKFEQVDPNVYHKVLTVLVNKRTKNDTFVYKVGYKFFQTLVGVSIPVELCQTAYLQLQQMAGHYDQDSSELFAILALDRGFLKKYARFIVTEIPMRLPSDYSPLGRAWKDPDAEEWVGDVVHPLLALEGRYNWKDMAGSLFFEIDTAQISRAVSYLEQMIRTYWDNEEVINWVFDTARRYLPEHHCSLILYFIGQNSDLEYFKRLNLLSRSVWLNGNDIHEEIRAAALHKIQEELSAAPQRINLLGHLSYLADRIHAEQQGADYTRRQRFRKLAF